MTPTDLLTRQLHERYKVRKVSFEYEPEVITLSPRSRHAQQQDDSQTTQEQASSLQAITTSYLKEKPRRAGIIIRPRPSESDTKPATLASEKTDASLSRSSSFASFQSAKSFWDDLDEKASKHDESSSAKVQTPIKISLKPSTDVLGLDTIVRVPKTPSKSPSKIPIPSSTPRTSFTAIQDLASGTDVKDFADGGIATSSCVAIVNGKEDAKPVCGPRVVARRTSMAVGKSAKMVKLSEYLANRRAALKSRIPVSSASFYRVEKTQEFIRAVIEGRPAPTRGSFESASAPQSDKTAQPQSLTVSKPVFDVTKLCISESATCPLGCDRDDCPRSSAFRGEVDRNSAMACVDEEDDD